MLVAATDWRCAVRVRLAREARSVSGRKLYPLQVRLPPMNLLFLDSTAVVATGPGSPAFFSRFAIEHLKSLGHNVLILPRFDPSAAQAADVVICEWANSEAYEAAASGLCKRLVIRLRGFDAHGPLDQMEWANVDALVYESPFLKSYVEKRFPGLQGFRSHVIPSRRGRGEHSVSGAEARAGSWRWSDVLWS